MSRKITVKDSDSGISFIPCAAENDNAILKESKSALPEGRRQSGKLEFVYFTIASTAVHLPLLQELSETLQAAMPRVTSANTSSTILSFAFDNGGHTSIFPSVLIFVYIYK